MTLNRFAALLFVRRRAFPASPRSVMLVGMDDDGDGIMRRENVVNIIDDEFHEDDVPLEIRFVVLRSNEPNNMMK